MEILIKRDPRGYFTATVGGKFFGNFDSVAEAMEECEKELGDVWRDFRRA